MQLGSLAYRASPSDNEKSPAELLMGRMLRTDLPILSEKLAVPKAKGIVKWRMRTRKSQKFYHDKKSKSLKVLKPRQCVRSHNPNTKLWDRKAMVQF